MIYNSVDNIPYKTYFKIIETKDFSLLSDDKLTDKQIITAWNSIEVELEKISLDSKSIKAFEVSKRIESIVMKQKAVEIAVFGLQYNSNDKKLQEVLKNYGYKNLDDLEQIERENKNESIRINNLKSQLPEETKNKESSDTCDEVLLSYAFITGAGFIDTNKITLGQGFSLIKIGNQKLKHLENGNNRKNNI